ncbi:MAG: metal-dependent transcriptional regulator [Spirochaetaceae bacterium]|nr:MAG: metal-dependent transcriptional regulator [Spirochaetaceae bacterium]
MASAHKPLTESLEMYLKAIYTVEQRKKAARVTDIAGELGVMGSSVTAALRSLRDRELINYSPYDIVTLTETGEEVARDVVRKYATLRDFFVKVLGMDEQSAEEDACHMEHRVSPQLFERLTRFVEYYETCPMEKVSWNDDVGYFCARPDHRCDQCPRPLVKIQSGKN